MGQRLTRCFTVPHARLGWVLVIIGLFAWYLFGRHADWNSLAFQFAQTLQTDGVVVSSAATDYTLGDEFHGSPIYAVRFSFTDAGGIQRWATSWTEESTGPPDSKVWIEFVESDPGNARIRNQRSGMLPLWVGSVLLFPIFGTSCILKVLLGQTSAKPSCDGAPETQSV